MQVLGKKTVIAHSRNVYLLCNMNSNFINFNYKLYF